jgi:hypothetical protein
MIEQQRARLLTETQDAAGRLNNLKAFMETDAFRKLPLEERELLYSQQRVMSKYVQILGKRLERAEHQFKHTSAAANNDKLTAAEAVFGFAGWLTSRTERTTMSSSDDAAPIAALCWKFIKENKLSEPRDEWRHNLIHPSGECSHGNYSVPNCGGGEQ